MNVNGEAGGQSAGTALDMDQHTLPGDLYGVPELTMLDFDLDIFDGIFGDNGFLDDEIDWTNGCTVVTPEKDTFGVFRNEARLLDLATRILDLPSKTDRSEEDRFRSLVTLQHLLSPRQAHRAISRYFESWHRICRIIHRPSFSVDSTPDCMLVAVVMLGAMYLPNEEDRKKALSVIDYVEDYVFAKEPSPLDGTAVIGTCLDDDAGLHFLQASFLVVVTQYWTGTERSKRRVSTYRFDRVLEVTTQNMSLHARSHVLTIMIDRSPSRVVPRDAHCRRPEKPGVVAGKRMSYSVNTAWMSLVQFSDTDR